MTKRTRVCIERSLAIPPASSQPNPRRATSGRAAPPSPRLWPPGSTLGVRFIGGTQEQRACAREQAGWWTRFANIQFRFDDAPDAELRVSFAADECAWSYIGTDARQVPLDQPTMNLGAAEGAMAAHEFGHALGLTHMRQNPSGGFRWNEQAVARDLARPPLHWTAGQVQAFLAGVQRDSIFGSWFDPASVMMDFYPAEWTADSVGSEPNDSLSANDAQAIAQLYPRK